MELIWCPPWSFRRGDGDEKRSVIFTQGFYLGKYEVTQEEYEKIMGNNPSEFREQNCRLKESHGMMRLNFVRL
jgi:formylglycine-generating enzyme required for sulfatase activity